MLRNRVPCLQLGVGVGGIAGGRAWETPAQARMYWTEHWARPSPESFDQAPLAHQTPYASGPPPSALWVVDSPGLSVR